MWRDVAECERKWIIPSYNAGIYRSLDALSINQRSSLAPFKVQAADPVDSTVNKYHVFAAYQVINLFAAFFNCYGKTLPWTASFTLYVSLISFFVILITVSSGCLSSRLAC
jgi:hypothetical protein